MNRNHWTIDRSYRAAVRNFKREMRRARRQQPPLWRPQPWWRIW